MVAKSCRAMSRSDIPARNSSSAGAGTIFATGILRGASFQTRIGARPGSRTGSLFIQPPGIPGSAGFSRTQVFSKSTSLGTSLATCTFQSEVGLETGGQGRAGGRTAQMTTRGLSDGHAGHLSRDDLSSTRRRSLGRKLSFSAHDFSDISCARARTTPRSRM